ncbi:GNAT family N-acetyltransferase [Pediococcus siamensis]|uniref:bifunctional helix-turn-helix transcriptional regulator/GNAT family N-acetyltransferase n=1 Tax=Pediococcus siamensis TaxID=381829 RepID=UPI0039A088B5
MLRKPNIETIRNFNRYYVNLFNKFDKELYIGTYSLNEARVIAEINAQEPTTATKIQAALNFDKGQLSRVITKLVQNNIVQRTANKQDKRHRNLSLTDQGKAVFSELTQKARTYLDQYLKTYADAQLKLIAQDMAEIEAILQKKVRVNIRQGQLADVGFIADLHSRIYQTEIKYNEQFHYYVFDALAKYVQHMDQGIVWIAEINHKRVGTISLIQDEQGQAQVRWFAVDPSYQGFGIGKKLLQKLMAYLTENAIQFAYLWTVDELSGARHLYHQQGFRCVESVKNTTWCQRAIKEEKWEWQQ